MNSPLSNAYTLTAYPHWVEKLNDTQLDSGSPLRWECKATGKPRPTYRWLKNGVPLLTQVLLVAIDQPWRGFSSLSPRTNYTLLFLLKSIFQLCFIIYLE